MVLINHIGSRDLASRSYIPKCADYRYGLSTIPTNSGIPSADPYGVTKTGCIEHFVSETLLITAILLRSESA